VKNKSNFSITITFIIYLLVIVTVSCRREEIPVINTVEMRDISDMTAVCGGSFSSDGGSEITNCGVCWSNDSTIWNFGKSNKAYNISKSNINSSNSFLCSITNLTPNTKYYVKAYATNKTGTGYGQTISFTTASQLVRQINFNPSINYGSLIDQDGNNYKTLTIGDQIWMAENLKAITFNDGETIPWEYYCWYNNDIVSNKMTCGALYNYDTATSKSLCPVGWHVPSIDEWIVLTNYLGGSTVAGGKLKEAGTTHWVAPNKGATNESGFTAIPGGMARLKDKNAFYIGEAGYWWSTSFHTEMGGGFPHTKYLLMYLIFDSENGVDGWPTEGTELFYSVRCVKD
jgi:uncharacterized protein (TIGR02145 family)